MPTSRPRHQITETPAVTRAIDLAARRWPGESRPQLLARLVAVAGAALEQSMDEAAQDRRRAIEASSGKYDDAFDAEYLAALRRDWPA